MAPLSQAEREKMLKQCEEQRLEVGRTWDEGLIVTLDLSEKQWQPNSRLYGAAENLHGGCSSCWTDIMGKGRELRALAGSSQLC